MVRTAINGNAARAPGGVTALIDARVLFAHVIAMICRDNGIGVVTP